MKRQVKSKTPITDDLEVHVSTVTAGGHSFVEIRHYIPSLKQYGRGVTIPRAEALNVAEGLDKCTP